MPRSAKQRKLTQAQRSNLEQPLQQPILYGANPSISNGQPHEKTLQETTPLVRYLPHDKAGVSDGSLGCLLTITRPYDETTIAEARKRATEAQQRIAEHRRTCPDARVDLAVYIIPMDGSRVVLPIGVYPLRDNPTISRWFSEGIPDSNGLKGRRACYNLRSKWITAQVVTFGLEVLRGRDPMDWFDPRYMDSVTPVLIAPSVRTSNQEMLLILQFLGMASFYKMPQEYEDLGLYKLRQTLDAWNIELVLSFVYGEYGPIWEPSPLPPSIGTNFGATFEPIMRMKAYFGLFHGCIPSPSARYKIMEMSLCWFRDNLPALKDLHQYGPTSGSPALGAIPNSIDYLCIPYAAFETEPTAHKLVTIRLMAAISPEVIANPDPGVVFREKLAPIILVSLPFGMLKYFLYITNYTAEEKFALATMLVHWRNRRIYDRGLEVAKETGQFVVRRCNAGASWIDDMAPACTKNWPQRNRYVEVPYLTKEKGADGTVTKIFDFKRYWYDWRMHTEADYSIVQSLLKDIDTKEDDIWRSRKKATQEIEDRIMGAR